MAKAKSCLFGGGSTMARKFTVGTGITQKTVSEWETSEDVRLTSTLWNADLSVGGFLGAIAQQAELICRQIMAANPTEWPEADSPEDFARSILGLLTAARQEIAKGDADRAARWAFQAGEQWAMATMKWAWEPAALTGRKVRHEGEGDHKGGRPSTTVDRDIRLAKEFLRLRPASRRSDSALKTDLGKQVGLKRSTAILAIDRGLQILSKKPG